MLKKLDIKMGDVFNKLTIICEVERGNCNQRRFNCKCECGKIKTVALGDLRSGKIKACGCLRKIPPNKQNLIGLTFGNLKVIDYDYTGNNKGTTYYICDCSCGALICKKRISVKLGNLKSNNTQSCTKTSQNVVLSTYKQIFWSGYSDGNLTLDQFIELSKQNCYLCGAEPFNKANCLKRDAKRQGIHSIELKQHVNYQKYLDSATVIYSGLDRINSGKPHDLDNVRPCCKYCNFAKLDRTTEEFDEWIKRVAKHRFGVII